MTTPSDGSYPRLARRLLPQVCVDAVLWAVAVVSAVVLRFDFSFARVNWAGVAVFLPLVVLAQVPLSATLIGGFVGLVLMGGMVVVPGSQEMIVGAEGHLLDQSR